MNNKEAINLSFRYLLLISLGITLVHGKLFDFIFTPLTYWPAYGILNIFYDSVASLEGNMLVYGGTYAQIVSACVAGAAYYLLLILNLTTPMSAVKRAGSIVFLIFTFLALNILRIVVFAGLATAESNYFDAAHMMMWYFGSTLMVVALWFFAVALFKIKEIPIYSDLLALYKDMKSKR